MKILLTGNPNVGKTTPFNALTARITARGTITG
ncbi:MAG: GTPase [Christensenellaceae bacterium]